VLRLEIVLLHLFGSGYTSHKTPVRPGSIRTEMHVSGERDILFEKKAEITDFF
jgi:hypothetical protein